MAANRDLVRQSNAFAHFRTAIDEFLAVAKRFHSLLQIEIKLFGRTVQPQLNGFNEFERI